MLTPIRDLLVESQEEEISEEGGVKEKVSQGQNFGFQDTKPRVVKLTPPTQVQQGPSGFPKPMTPSSPEIITELSLGWPELSLFGAVCFEWYHYFIFKLPIMHPLKIP